MFSFRRRVAGRTKGGGLGSATVRRRLAPRSARASSSLAKSSNAGNSFALDRAIAVLSGREYGAAFPVPGVLLVPLSPPCRRCLPPELSTCPIHPAQQLCMCGKLNFRSAFQLAALLDPLPEQCVWYFLWHHDRGNLAFRSERRCCRVISERPG